MPQKTPTVTFKNIKKEASGDDTPKVQWYEMTTKQLFGDKNPFYFPTRRVHANLFNVSASIV